MPGEKLKSFARYNINSRPISSFMNDRASKMHGGKRKIIRKKTLIVRETCPINSFHGRYLSSMLDYSFSYFLETS